MSWRYLGKKTLGPHKYTLKPDGEPFTYEDMNEIYDHAVENNFKSVEVAQGAGSTITHY